MSREIINVLAGLLILFSLNSCFETCEENRRRNHLQESFEGSIEAIYLDRNRKNQPFVIVKKREFIIINDLYEFFSVGDTLFKRSGSMKYYWVKNGDTTVFYQMCGGRAIDAVKD